jgi:hypothetical protein
MALMQALLKIKADVEGSGAVQALGRSINGLGSAASRVSGGLKGMAGAAGGLAGSMGSLVPLLSAAGLAGLAKNSIDAGNKMHDLSQQTGVSVEMLARFKKAAALSGTTLEAVTSGLGRLSKAMAAAVSSSDFGRMTKAEMEKAKDAVEEGEKEQTRIVKAQADERVKKLEDESDDRLKELNKRYRREEQLLNDQFDDQADAAEQAADDRTESQIKAIQREFDQRKKAIQSNQALSDGERERSLNSLEDSEDRALDIVRNNAAEEGKLRKRAARDQQQVITDQLSERKAAEEKAIRDRVEGQKAIIQRGAEDQTLIIKRASEDAVKALKIDPGDSALEDELEQLGLTGKGASDAFRELQVSITNSDGTLRSSGDVMLDIANKFKAMEDGPKKAALAMKLMGRGGAELIPMLNMGGDAIEKMSVKMTAAFAEDMNKYADKLTMLGGKVGAFGADIAILLLPHLEKLTDNLIKGLDAFRSLDPSVQGLIIKVGGLGIGFLLLAPAIMGVIGVLGFLGKALGLLGGLKIGATIAGWAGAIGPAIAAISAAFTGFLTFLTGTLLPGLIAFFSGPVGWTVLAVAAVVAMAILFRKPLQDFAGWLVSWGKPISKFFTDYITTPISNAWKAMVEFLPTALNTAAATIKNVFTGVGIAIKAVLNGILRGVFNSVNGAIENINRLIRATNAISAKVGGPRFDQLPTLKVPQFAKGGYVGAGTLAVVGEAGPEYIVPERKAAAFAMNYLNGARGGAAIPAFANGGFVGGNAQINVTTGPVMQQGGQQYVSMADLERAMRKTADGVYASLRTPAGRYATGVR